jgi:membrane protease YdiL (CAAX protease family)
MPYLEWIIHHSAPWELHHWLYKIFHNIGGLVIVLGVILAYYKVYDRQQSHRYGLNTGAFELKPYLLMLLIMIPLIAVASHEESFLRQYPMYKTSNAHGHLHVHEWVTAGIYELSYGANFITVEFLFRGFMVIGISQVLGRKAVLPMVAAYCFIHFGKPPVEAISSIVGGYILGVIALETQSIWGGVLVHVGIAWMMELAAFVIK